MPWCSCYGKPVRPLSLLREHVLTNDFLISTSIISCRVAFFVCHAVNLSSSFQPALVQRRHYPAPGRCLLTNFGHATPELRNVMVADTSDSECLRGRASPRECQAEQFIGAPEASCSHSSLPEAVACGCMYSSVHLCATRTAHTRAKQTALFNQLNRVWSLCDADVCGRHHRH